MSERQRNKQEDLTNIMTGHCPTIVNQTDHTIVVFQERGLLFNKQVLQPGEAVSISRGQTGGFLVPYYIHAVIGDERSLPDRKQSIKNLMSVAAIPTAFCVGAIVAAMSAGTLTGPSLALAPLVSGCVVNGVVIDAAAIAAGTIMASRAAVISEFIVKKHPSKFMCRSRRLRPGKRFVVVTGGVNDNLLIHDSVKESEFLKLGVQTFKSPMDTIKDKIKYYIPGIRDDEGQLETRQDHETRK
jgi:hypothetical protein